MRNSSGGESTRKAVKRQLFTEEGISARSPLIPGSARCQMQKFQVRLAKQLPGAAAALQALPGFAQPNMGPTAGLQKRVKRERASSGSPSPAGPAAPTPVALGKGCKRERAPTPVAQGKAASATTCLEKQGRRKGRPARGSSAPANPDPERGLAVPIPKPSHESKAGSQGDATPVPEAVDAPPSCRVCGGRGVPKSASCDSCTAELSAKRGLRFARGQRVWCRGFGPTWPARVAGLSFASPEDPKPYFVLFFGDWMGAWVGDGSLCAWDARSRGSLALSNLRGCESKRRKTQRAFAAAMAMAEADAEGP